MASSGPDQTILYRLDLLESTNNFFAQKTNFSEGDQSTLVQMVKWRGEKVKKKKYFKCAVNSNASFTIYQSIYCVPKFYFFVILRECFAIIRNKKRE